MLVFLLSLALLPGCDGGAAPPKAFSVPVVLGPVTRGPASIRVTLDGEATDPGEALVGAEVAGTVLEAPARVGDAVKRGSPLVRLDPRPFRIGVAQAKAALDATLADVAVKAAARDRVRASTARVVEVADKEAGSLSPREVEDARLNLAEAEASLQAAEAQTAVKRAALDAATLDLARATVESPVDGVVALQSARIGQRVAAGTPLVTVTAGGALEVVLEAGEAWAGRIVSGAGVVLWAAGRPEVTVAGTVAGVVPATVGQSRTQRIRVDLAGVPSGLTAGMAVRAEVTVAELPDALQVPRDAVVDSAVFVAAEGVVKRVVVTILDAGPDALVIEAALNGGESVVVRGNEALSDGGTITVIESGAPSTP